MKRNIGIDSLRGLLLVWMTFNHLPGLSAYTFEALGFISSIEGFVFISGIVAGMVYGRIGLCQGSTVLRKRAFRRAFDIYLFHMASLVFLVILEFSLSNEIYASFYQQMNPFSFRSPITTLGMGALFLLQPSLLDILPMYCLFLLITPFCINRFKNNQGYLVLSGSFLFWALATYHHHSWENLSIFLFQFFLCWLGWFNPIAWQFLFVGGLFLGFQRNIVMMIPIKKSLIALALLIWVGIMLVRYGAVPSLLFGFDLFNLTLREVFGPLRVINLLILAYLIMCVATRFPRLLEWPWFSFLGQHSLQVFTFHLLLIFAIYPLFDHFVVPSGWTVIILANIAVVSTLTIPAWLHVKYRTLKSINGGPTNI